LNEHETVSLSADSKDTVRFSEAQIDDSARDGNVDVTVRLSGIDKNGAVQGETLVFTLEINRQSHEIRLDSLNVNPGTIPCEGDRTVRIDTRVTNIGKHDEDDTYVEVDATPFGFKEKRSIGKLNEDDSTGVSFTFMPPKTVKTGSYQVIVNSYYDTQIKSSTKSVTIAVPECGFVAPTPTPQPNSTVVVTPTPVVPQPQPTPVVPTPAPRVTPQTSFMDSTAYIVVLGVAGVVILLLLVFLIVKLAGRKSE